MPKVFHRGRDEGKKRRHYFFNLECADGKRRQKKGFTDRAKTEQLAAKMQHEEDLRRLGLIDPHQEEIRKRELAPLAECFEDFEAKLAKATPKYRALVVGRARRVMEGCKFATAADISAEVVERFLDDIAKQDDLGPRTYNHYLQACQQFTKRLWKSGRRSVDPLIGLETRNAEVDVRHQRRALSAGEVAQLVQSARDSGVEIQCFDGETRARIYILSYMTGLRKKEIASLTPGSFALDATPPTVTVEARAAKNRRRTVLPLHPELAAMLTVWISSKATNERLFPGLEKRRGYLMVRKDLERIGIPYVTELGVADFHAAGRHSHITELLRHGASLPEVRELARHADVRQTMKYTHIGLDDQARAVGRLPWHQIGTAPGDSESPPKSPSDTVAEPPVAVTSYSDGISDTLSHSVAPCDNGDKKGPAGFDPRRLHFCS